MKGQRTLLIKGAVWVSAASALVNLLGVVSLLVLTRLLMPDDFGLMAIGSAFAEIITMMTELSLATALVQRRDLKPAHFHTAFTLNAIRGCIVGTLMLFAAPLLADAYGDPRLTAIIQALAISTFAGGLTNPKLILFQRDLDFSKTFIMQVCNRLMQFVVTITIAFLYQSYWALVIGIVASSLTTLVLSYVLIPYRPRFSLSAWRDLLSFSIWLTLGAWVQTLNWRAQPLVYGFFLSTPVLGQYNVGRRLAGRTIRQATVPIKAILFPAFSKLQEHQDRLRSGYMRSQGTICLITFPVVAIFVVLAELLVPIALGEKWLPAVPVVQVLAISQIGQAVQNVNALATATANTKALFFRDVRALLVRWPLILGGLFLGGDDPFEKLVGALIGQVIGVAINSVWNMQLIAKISEVSLRDHMTIIWRPLLAAITMGIIMALAHNLVPPSENFIDKAMRLVALMALGAATYISTLFVIWSFTGRGESVEKEVGMIIRQLVMKAIARVRTS